MKTNLLDNVLAKDCCNICISSNLSFIYVFNTGIKDMEQYRRLTEKAFKIGKKLKINKYLFDAAGPGIKERFIVNCEYFYKTVFYISNISAAEKIALLLPEQKNSNNLISRLTNYYMDNFKVFNSKNTAIEYLMQDEISETSKKLKYPCSAIPKYSILEFSVNTNKAKCLLCRNTKFRFDPDMNRISPFKCMKCGAEYSIHDFSYTEKSKFNFRIIG